MDWVAADDRWAARAGWGRQILAAEKFVFVTSAEARRLTALDARTGAVVWEKSVPAAPAAMALAYGRLYWFVNDYYDGLILCLSPESGATLWETRERGEHTPIPAPGWVPEDPCVADGHLFYVNAGRIRVRDAETGSLVWESWPDAQAGSLMRLLVGSEGLIAVCDKQTLFYKHAHREFIPRVAQGGGYRTPCSSPTASRRRRRERSGFTEPTENRWRWRWRAWAGWNRCRSSWRISSPGPCTTGWSRSPP